MAVGDIVELTGLQSQPQFNGRLGAVTGWVATCLAWTVSGQVAPLTTIARVAGEPTNSHTPALMRARSAVQMRNAAAAYHHWRAADV